MLSLQSVKIIMYFYKIMENVHQNRVVESNITMYNTTTQSFTPPIKF